ncbi:MAG: cysteine hydrolase [Alphaproteobacteria bacterium]|jgi:ureidoacrylate peracid hydrolase|nr:cysteine hydrolase [Alphaproteobacteria bacterium]MBT4082894.1 cysteine hydrolase [Alphaproteobacteria bacterium]MBT4546596.1 cysteine hydrolase [Alphaproteobacteria bacterium]MBT7747450.1 cysteine hydrolase [Alphaproteobacteria bacterium]
MNELTFDPNKTALLIVDMQNDFYHPEGAYGRANCTSPGIADLPPRIKPVADALRAAGGWVVSIQFTLVPGKDGEPFIAPHLKKMRPFLAKGDFAPGSWGQSLIDELQPADLTVEKVAYSAFYQSRLEWLLKKTEVETVLVCGIVTNGGVAATLRDAHTRDFHTVLLSDGCGALNEELHNAAITSMSTVAEVLTCGEITKKLEG